MLVSLSGSGKVLYADSSIGEGMDITIEGEPNFQVRWAEPNFLEQNFS